MLRNFLFFSILSILTISSYSSAADIEKPFANSWDISKGLVNNNVYSIAEDQLGRIWLATPGGVSIIDGLGITNLKSDSSRSDSISSNVITKVIAYENSMLVLGLHGIDIVNPYSLSSTPVYDPDKLLVRATNLLFVDEDTAFVVAQNKLIHWDITQNLVKEVDLVTSQLRMNALYHYDADEILLSSPDGYYRFNYQTNEVQEWHTADFNRQASDVRANAVDSQKRLWISVFGKGIYVVEENELVKHFDANESAIHSNLISKLFQQDRYLYAVTRKGIEVFDVDSLGHVKTIQPTSHNNTYMKSDMALTAEFKSDGDLLVGTTNGFYVVETRAHQPYFKVSEKVSNTNNLEFFESFTTDDKLLIRTRSSLLSITKDGDVKNVPANVSQIYSNPIAQDQGLLLYEDNTLVIASEEENKVLNITGLPGGTKLLKVIKDNEDGRFFLFDDSNLFISERVGDALVVQLSRQIGEVLVADAKVYNNVLYLATQKAGLLSIPYYSFNNKNVSFKRIPGPKVPINIYIDSSDKLWVLTLEDGFYYHVNESVGVNLTKFKEQLSNFNAVCLAEDRNGFLWFVTNTGVSIFSSDLELAGRFYNEIEVSERFTVNNCGNLQGKVYISTPVEVFIFDAWKKGTELPTLNLGYSNIAVNGGSIADSTKAEYVEPSILTFSLYSSSLNFESDYKLLYRVVNQDASNTESEEEAWLQSSSREINLIKPNLGDFMIEAQIKLNDGTESQVASFDFSVKPPYYRSPFMLWLYVLIILGVLSLLFFYKLKLKNSELKVAKIENEKQQEYAKRLAQEVDEKTRLYREQQQLAVQANIDKTRFIASASHDIRAPLNAIRWKLHDILDQSDVNTGRVMEEISILDQLVQSIVNLSKFDAKIIKPNYNVFNIDDLINELKERFSQSIQSKNISFTVSTTRNSTYVYTDKFLLLRLVNNIVDNAIKSLNDGGQLEIRIQGSGSDKVNITIKDNGPGIDEELQSKVFDSFIRGTKKYSGTGLGLTIVKQISEVLEIDLNLESDHTGTTFWFELQKSEPQELEHSINIKDSKLTALVIDDDLFYANDAKVKLEEIGFVATMIDDISSLDNAVLGHFNIVLCDYNLGVKINGVDLLIDKLEQKHLSCEQVVIMSEDSSVRQEAKEKKAFQFLRKPVKRSKLSWICQQNLE